MKTKEPTKPLELVGAKIRPEVKAVIEKQAADEERSISQVISRLLASHPEVKRSLRQSKVAA